MGYPNKHQNSVAEIDLSGISLKDPSAELFDSKAEYIANTFAEAKGQANKSTQIRRFYDEYCQFVEKVGIDQNKLDELTPFIRMLRAKAAYAEGRKLVDKNFTRFIEKIVREADCPKSLRHGKTLFEAVMGFLKLYEA